MVVFLAWRCVRFAASIVRLPPSSSSTTTTTSFPAALVRLTSRLFAQVKHVFRCYRRPPLALTFLSSVAFAFAFAFAWLCLCAAMFSLLGH